MAKSFLPKTTERRDTSFNTGPDAGTGVYAVVVFFPEKKDIPNDYSHFIAISPGAVVESAAHIPTYECDQQKRSQTVLANNGDICRAKNEVTYFQEGANFLVEEPSPVVHVARYAFGHLAQVEQWQVMSSNSLLAVTKAVVQDEDSTKAYLQDSVQYNNQSPIEVRSHTQHNTLSNQQHLGKRAIRSYNVLATQV